MSSWICKFEHLKCEIFVHRMAHQTKYSFQTMWCTHDSNLINLFIYIKKIKKLWIIIIWCHFQIIAKQKEVDSSITKCFNITASNMLKAWLNHSFHWKTYLGNQLPKYFWGRMRLQLFQNTNFDRTAGQPCIKIIFTLIFVDRPRKFHFYTQGSC